MVVLIIGLWSCFVNYWADFQKQEARRTGGKCTIWGKGAQIIEAEYVSGGKTKSSILLVSGGLKCFKFVYKVSLPIIE